MELLSFDDEDPQEVLGNALAQLLACGVVKVTTHHMELVDKSGNRPIMDAPFLYIDVENIFNETQKAYALNCSQINTLLAFVKDPAYKAHGHYRWLALQFNQKPVTLLVQQLKRAGAWDEVLEALPANVFETDQRKHYH